MTISIIAVGIFATVMVVLVIVAIWLLTGFKTYGHSEKAIWTCLECGNEEEIEMPEGWNCSVCGYPKESRD